MFSSDWKQLGPQVTGSKLGSKKFSSIFLLRTNKDTINQINNCQHNKLSNYFSKHKYWIYNTFAAIQLIYRGVLSELFSMLIVTHSDAIDHDSDAVHAINVLLDIYYGKGE